MSILIILSGAYFFTGTFRSEIPLILQKHRKGYLSYIFALYFTMSTTALTNYYAFTKRFASLLNISYERCLPASSGFAFIYLSFELVNKMYPLFGGIRILPFSIC